MSFHKTISMGLSTESIDNAIREIRKLRSDLKRCCNELVQVLTEEGVTIAKMNVMSMNAVLTGDLEESIRGVFNSHTGTGVIFTNVPYALYVEFGTGIVGEANAHDGDTDIPWEYDVNDHGDSGWWYYASIDGIAKFRWTKGMPARPYMYNTLRWLQDNYPDWADAAFSKL